MTTTRRVPRSVAASEDLAPGSTEAREVSTATRNLEARHDRFVRLANTRGKRLIRDIRALGQLGSPYYARKPEEVERLSAVLLSELQDALGKLRHGTKKSVEDIL